MELTSLPLGHGAAKKKKKKKKKKECRRFKSAKVKLDLKRHSVREDEVKLKEVKNSV